MKKALGVMRDLFLRKAPVSAMATIRLLVVMGWALCFLGAISLPLNPDNLSLAMNVIVIVCSLIIVLAGQEAAYHRGYSEACGEHIKFFENNISTLAGVRQSIAKVDAVRIAMKTDMENEFGDN